MPKPLFSKLVAICAIGFFCLFFGIVYAIYSKDSIFLMLSLSVGLCSALRFFLLFRIIRSKRYYTLTGLCVKREMTLFGKNQEILFRTMEEPKCEYQAIGWSLLSALFPILRHGALRWQFLSTWVPWI